MFIYGHLEGRVASLAARSDYLSSPNPAPTHSVNTHGRFTNSRTAVHTHSQPSPPAPLHAATSRRLEVEAVPPHQRLVAGEVGSLSSNGMLPVASSSKPWIAPSRAPSKGRVRDSNVRDADETVPCHLSRRVHSDLAAVGRDDEAVALGLRA